MLKAIQHFFDNRLAGENQQRSDEQGISKLDLASAALMIEVMNSDHKLDAREDEELTAILVELFSISEEDCAVIRELAMQEARDATSLYQFTKLINDHYSYDEKVSVVENMWRIAFADGELDKYEDHVIRKVAELLYVRHSDFIKSKLAVKARVSV